MRIAPVANLLSTKNLTDMAWTGFFGSSNASNDKNLADVPASIPTLQVGDIISVTNANQTTDYHGMKADYPPGTLILLPVCIFDAGTPASFSASTTLWT